MYVKNRMTSDVVTISSDASIATAFQLMMEKKCSQLPVVDGHKIVGLVTEKLLTEVSPSKATTLSIYELNYLLSKTKVKDIMKSNIITVEPDILLEEAAVLMRNHDINSLPVVENTSHLVGIITKIDIFDAFIELIGVNDAGTRIALEVKDELGTIAEICQIIKGHGININHISNFNQFGAENHSELIIRLGTTDVDHLIESLTSHGYIVLSVMKK